MYKNMKGFAMIMCMFGFVGSNVLADGMEYGSPPMYCADLNPQNTLDIQQVSLSQI